jgi:hypothetical protein
LSIVAVRGIFKMLFAPAQCTSSCISLPLEESKCPPPKPVAVVLDPPPGVAE